MEKVVVELDVKSKGGVQEVEKLNKKLTETKTQSKEAGASLDGVSGGAIGKFKGLQSSIGGVVTGFKSLKFAILASGIGALLLAVLAVGKAFTNSEEGQNKFAKIMGVIGSVTGNLVDILASLGEKIISVFENPKQAIADFSNLIKDNIINRFTGILELIPSLSKSIKQLFSGDFSGAAQTAGNAVAKVVLGTDNLTDSIKRSASELKKFAAEVAADAKSAGEIADQRAKADKIERKLIVERAEADKEIAELRFKTEQRDKFSAKERVKFLKDASKISENIAAKEIGLNNIRLNAQIAENKLAGSKKADLNAVAELTAKSIQLETSKLSLQKRLQTSLTSFQTEELSGIKAISDAKKKVTDKEEADEIKNAELIQKIRDSFTKKNQDKEDEDNLSKIERQYDRDLAELEALDATELQKYELKKYYDNLLKEEQEKIIKEFNEFEAAAEIDAEDARLAGALKQYDALKIIADKEIELEKQKTEAKHKALNDLASIFGAESAMGKAALIAKQLMAAQELLIDLGAIKSKATKAIVTSQLNAAESGGAIATGFSKTLSLGFPAAIPALIGYAATAVGIVSSVLSATKKTKSVASQFGGGGGGGGSPTITAPSIASIPPAFNIVGQSDTNQLASAIGGQSQQPVKAYVVSGDVTNAQEMDRNIIQGASL